MGARVRVGSLEELKAKGHLLTQVGARPVCVFYHEGRADAVDDRCPHMGFPLHRGTLRDGILTCDWHHARFDLASGGTLDPWADDARSYPVVVEGEEVFVLEPDPEDVVPRLRRRLVDGLEETLPLVLSKAVLGLLEAGVPSAEVVRLGVDFGTRYRAEGWGSGLTVLVAMANLLDRLDPEDRPRGLVHGLAFVARDTAGHPPRFPPEPLPVRDASEAQLTAWYRQFVETRSEDAAERTLVTAIAAGLPRKAVHRMVFAAATDHVFLDEGHVLDLTNKAFEALDHLGWEAAGRVLPTLVRQTVRAERHEEADAWRYPVDVVALVDDALGRVEELGAEGRRQQGAFGAVADLAWRILEDDPKAIVDGLCEALAAGATEEEMGRALALAAGLRITRFHVQNDFADWDVVHHGFTYANGLHQALSRHPSPELLRGVFHGAMKVYLDRYLNVPPARLPETAEGDLAELEACWEEQGRVDETGALAYGYLRGGGDPGPLVAALGRALLAEDAGFHMAQTVEAAVRQAHAWPPGSEEGALLLAGAARFLAAHTPTRRQLPQTYRIADRLRRGEKVYEG